MNEFTVGYVSRRARQHQDGGARRWRLLRQSVLGVVLVVACQSALSQALYRIKSLGYLGGCTSFTPVAYGFNATDEVTGQACNAAGDLHAFLWKNNGTAMIDLGPSEAGSTSYGNAVNAHGLVAGSATDSTGDYGFVSSGNGSPLTKIPNGLGGTGTYAYGLNDSGQVTGEAGNPPPYDYATDAFLWKQGSGMIDLGGYATGLPTTYGLYVNASGKVAGAQFDGDRSTNTFIWENDGSPAIYLGGQGEVRGPIGINTSGQVAGTFSAMGYAHPHAFYWRNDGTGMHDLGTLPGGSLSEAYAQNDSGQIAGGSWKGYFVKETAFIWMNNGTPMKSLGTLGGANSESDGINASGQVTGWSNPSGSSDLHAFLWRNDGTAMQDLNALIDPTDPLKPYVTLTMGEYIDAFGDVVAEGVDSRSAGAGELYLLQGTVLTLNPRSLAFGSVPIHTSSAAKSVTMTNTSPRAAAVTTIALTAPLRASSPPPTIAAIPWRATIPVRSR